MNSDGYAAPPSNSNIYQRLPSLDTTNPTSYTPNTSGPSFSSIPPATSQRTLPPDQLSGQAPGLSGVRGPLNSNNHMSGGITNSNRGFISTNDNNNNNKSPGISDLGHKNMSSNNNNNGDVVSQQKQPNLSDLAGQRDKSSNGVTSESESLDQRDYVGISLVGRKFKQLNPEAYYVEKDE